MSPRPLRTVASVSSVLTLVAGGIAATTAAASAVPSDVDTTLCAGTNVWTGGFDPSADFGKPVHGKTTTHGLTPEPFTGTYVSTLKNGAGKGKDILLFRMQGSRITKTDVDGNINVDAGIWAGMSGSPVYDADENLVGSVSYGFSGAPSNLAGVTPAADILDIQNSPTTTTTTTTRTAAIPQATKTKLAAASASTTDTPSTVGGLRRLALPRFSVGVADADGRNAATSIAAKSRHVASINGAQPKFHTGSQYDGDLDPTAALVPGGNIATAWSHGDVAMAAVGTITAVCGDKVFAFGHPDNFDGAKATETFHAAYADDIQEDGTFGSYKLASIDMEPIGQITQDRLSGIMGVKGKLPVETSITTTTKVGSATATAETKVSVPAALSSAVGSQVFSDVLDGLDAYSGGGEALMTWEINYTSGKGGAPATYTRTQRLSAQAYFAEEAPYDVASDIEFLQYGSDTKVTINSVKINTELWPDYNALRVAGIDVRSNGKWVKVKNGAKVSARRGKAFPVQVRLVPANGESVAEPVIRRLDQTISKSAYGTGLLTYAGGKSYYGDFKDQLTIDMDEEDFEEFYYDEDESLTLPEVLAALKAQVRYDSIRSSHQYRTRFGDPRSSSKSTDSPTVTTGSAYIRLSYRS